MNIRRLNYEEAKTLYDQLVKIGYPAQILVSDKNWKVIVDGLIEEKTNKTLERLV